VIVKRVVERTVGTLAPRWGSFGGTSTWWYPDEGQNHASQTGGVDRRFGTGIDGAAKNEGYYRIDLCEAHTSGAYFNCQKLWVRSVAQDAP
jgi:hypothetical protein